ncbi:MAG: hypothetical protein A4E39_01853 [Methanoregulaceae archaeon PtaB.Bin152]|nr:MAG: hypothetical protein A4E39_01853 [Methanoregulaceae archaeon PtaB.Bin152]
MEPSSVRNTSHAKDHEGSCISPEGMVLLPVSIAQVLISTGEAGICRRKVVDLWDTLKICLDPLDKGIRSLVNIVGDFQEGFGSCVPVNGDDQVKNG